MLTPETKIQTSENGRFDDQQKADHNRKTKIFIAELTVFLDFCNKSNTKQHSKA